MWRSDEDGQVVALQVSRAEVEIILNRNPERSGGGRLFLELERGLVAKLSEEFRLARVPVAEGYWGMPVRAVRDPDGNDILMCDDELVESELPGANR